MTDLNNNEEKLSVNEMISLINDEKVNEKEKKPKRKHKKNKNFDFEKKTNKKIKKIKNKERRRRIKRIILAAFMILFTSVLIYIFKTFYPEYKTIKEDVYIRLSDMNENTFKRKGNTEIYDKDNNLIAQYGNEKYEYITYDKISHYITDGYIAKEDRNFMIHNGVDYKAIARAAYELVKHKGKITQGGSTITQQIVKNNILSSEQTYKRKITEALCARSLEKQYNKNQIMEFYCNGNYYGNGCYGIEGACQYYFGKSASDITLSEAAMMVATSNLPNEYNPVANYDLCLEQRDNVLYDMYNCTYISKEDYQNALNETPEILQVSTNVITNNFLSSYALHCATEKVMEINGFEFKYLFNSQDEYEQYTENYNKEYNQTIDYIKINGFKIYTSLDQNIQKKLQKTIDKNLEEFPERDENGLYELQSAAVCVDNTTNMVVAVVGGRGDEGYFNRGYQAERQSGSSIKPLLDYAPAINEGYVLPGTVMDDKEVDYDGFKPQNANRKFVGKVTVRSALLQSINTVAVQLYMMVKPEIALQYLNNMKFCSLTYADMIAPSLSIGGFTRGVTVENMAKGYSTLANNGNYSNETCLLSITNYDNSINYRANNQTVEVYNADTAFIISDMLEQTFEEESGAGFKYKDNDQIYAGKTGTTNDTKDVWFCGYSKYYSTAVWIGYDTPAPMEDITSGSYPCKIFTEFMDKIHKGLKPLEFDIPDTVQLTNSDGDIKAVDYDTDIYHSRPDGWDYCSTLLFERIEEHSKEDEEERLEIEAELAVSEFEDFQITTTEEAKSIKEKYNYTYEKVTSVGNSEIRSKLMDRVAKKWSLLDGELLGKWNDAIEEEEKAAQELKDAENIEQAQKSIEQAEIKKKETIIGKAEYYINALNDCKIYTEYVEELVEGGNKAIDDSSIYKDEYDSLYDRFVEAVKYARSLPEQTEDDSEDVAYSENEDE